MKRKIAFSLLAVIALGMVACGAKNKVEESSQSMAEVESSVVTEDMEASEEISSEVGSSEAEVAVSGALDILNTIWATYGEDEKFAVAGGDSANMSFDGPGVCDPTNSADLDSLFGFPAGQVANIDDAASMMHAMNQNTFTAGVYHVTDVANVQTVADELKTNILGRQWLCGFPETLIVVSVDDYVISAFGNGELIETFKTKIAESYESAVVLHETPIE